MSLKVFISYAKEDRDRALDCYKVLAQAGTSPWLDEQKILPGQNWQAEIEKAFKDANVIVLLLSKNSVGKRGFVQREANDAIEQLRYKQPTDIYFIPLLLEPCDVPTQIAGRLQYVDISTSGAWDQVRASLKLAAEQQSIQLAEGLVVGPFRVFTEKFQEQWKGAPGHDISIEYPRFESTSQRSLAEELTLFFAGRACQALIDSRQKPWDQSPEFFKDTDDAAAMDGRWESFGIVNATDRMLSLTYDVGWYGAGAAHPNSYFETYNFALLERVCRVHLTDFFSDDLAAIKRLSKLCIAELCREYWGRVGEKPDEGQMLSFRQGAGADYENFSAFTVSPDRFTFLFAPYEVSAYALGRWSVDVSFYDLLDVLKPEGPHIFSAATP